MSCHICARPPTSNPPLQFHCPTCARNQLYTLRLEHAQVLLQKDVAGREIEGALSKGAHDPAEEANPTRWSIQAAHTRSSQSTARSQLIRDRVAVLKDEIRERREEIDRWRAKVAQKRSDAESANYQLSDRRATALRPIQGDIKKIEQRWNTLHTKTAESRVFLCREAANLYGLRQKTRRRNGAILSTYALAGISIVDLRDLNNASPAHITTSMTHVAHLLVLVSHYLSLRLPAEITLPHRGYPLPTAFPPAASYMSGDHQFPGTTPSHSSSTSPTASRTPETKPLPRPRPLYINRTLPKLAKEDPATYNLFLEGVSLLAWDVAWTCKTQGLNVGSDSWEDICDMGRNLWQLLIAPPALTRALSGREPTAAARNGRGGGGGGEPSSGTKNGKLQRANSFPQLGHFSHGTAHSFLGSAEGTEYMRSWKSPSPLKLADKLKSMLLSEMTSAEWELVEENEWEDGGAAGGEQTAVPDTGPSVPETAPPPPPPAARGGDTKRAPSHANGKTKTAIRDEKDRGDFAQNDEPKKGTSGWTKVKSRT